MRVLLVGPEEKEEIARVKSHAESNRYSQKRLHALMHGQEPPAGDSPGHTCHIPLGFKVVYTIEEQPPGWCHHLSVSVDDINKEPNSEAIEFLMAEFGIKTPFSKCFTYVEEVGRKAVNVIALYGS